jgi:hypothetical protein
MTYTTARFLGRSFPTLLLFQQQVRDRSAGRCSYPARGAADSWERGRRGSEIENGEGRRGEQGKEGLFSFAVKVIVSGI